MGVPTDRRYSQTHEWCQPAGDRATIGLTKFAVDQLTDITFLDLPAAGAKVTAGRPCGTVESVKAANDIYAPVSGEVLESNRAALEDPAVVNQDPFGAGWLIRLRPDNPDELNALLDAARYDQLTGQ